MTTRFLKMKSALGLFGLLVVIALSQIVPESYAEARAGGGRSGGFRGTRSYSSPARPVQPTNPTQARREALPSQQPSPMAAPQFGGFMGGLGTAVLGGFLGSMLFSGLAHGFGGGLGGLGGSGFGMIEILLIGGLAYFVYRKFRSPTVASGYGTIQYQNTQPYTRYSPSSAPEATPTNGIDYRSLTMMDRTFSLDQFLKNAQDIFFKVQGAWNKQDTQTLRAVCGSELMKTWDDELTSLRAGGQQNKMENIALRESEITEVWTESGEDYITVRLLANLLDYDVDAKTGAVAAAAPIRSSSKNTGPSAAPSVRMPGS
jgi:predicted lipid-binding transport protein (Tim44 family)